MHVDFADWYRICTTGTEVTSDLLTHRWSGVEQVIKESSLDVLNLVRIALQKKVNSAEPLSRFKAAFKEADATFAMSGNDLELSVLAGAGLAVHFENQSDEADEAALGLLCAVSVAECNLPWAKPFIARADTYINNRLRTVRMPPTILGPQFQPKSIKAQFETFATRLATNDPAQTSEAAKQMCEALQQVLTSTTKAASQAIAELDRQSRLRREETDVLWWLTAGVSRDLGVAFRDLKALAAPIIAGKELADLVSPPGVLPAKSLLHHVVPLAKGKAAEKPVELQAAINATELNWREQVVNGLEIDQVADLCPVLAAVKQSLTTQESDGWLAAYKHAYGIDPAISLHPVDLAHQIYRECLLARLAVTE